MGARHQLLAGAVATFVLLAGCSGDEGSAPPSSGGRSSPGSEGAPGTSGKDTRVTIGAAGDVLPHYPVQQSAARNAAGSGYDFTPMFAEVTDLLTGPDVTLCHMETPISSDDTYLTPQGSTTFNTAFEIADALVDAGYDGCDTASNHTWDRTLDGLTSTRSVLEDAGLQVAGPAASEGGERQATYEVDGVDVTQLAYTYTIHNSATPTTTVPEEAPWLRDSLWPAVGADGILEDAEKAKGDGADFVVVSMHWGAEYQTEPTDEQLSIATELLESDSVDLILGTHAHVVQPCEKVNGKYVLYGMGNSLSNQSPETSSSLRPETQEGLIAHVGLTKDSEGEVSSTLRYQPTKVRLKDHIIEPATERQHPETHERVTETMESLGEGKCDATPME